MQNQFLCVGPLALIDVPLSFSNTIYIEVLFLRTVFTYWVTCDEGLVIII